MPDMRIVDLGRIDSLNDSDYVVVGSGNETYKATISTLKQAVRPSLGRGKAYANGVYHASDEGLYGYDTFTVNVQNTRELEMLSVSKNGYYTPSPSVDGFYAVSVNVSGGGGGGGGMDALIARTIAEVNSDAEIIGDYVFQGCSSLTTVSFPACTSIGNYAFQGCSSLTTVSFPACTSIGDYAFLGCSSLTTVSFPACTSIGNYVFQGCSSLTTVSFPACTSIGYYAFQGCSSLTTVSFPARTSIGDYAFLGCSSLTTVSFPACTRIGYSAFYQCYRLVSLYITASSVCYLVASSAFKSTPIAGFTSYTGGAYGSIFVPASLVDAYKSAARWSYFADRITAY